MSFVQATLGAPNKNEADAVDARQELDLKVSNLVKPFSPIVPWYPALGPALL